MVSSVAFLISGWVCVLCAPGSPSVLLVGGHERPWMNRGVRWWLLGRPGGRGAHVGSPGVSMCREILERLEVDALVLKRAQYEAFSFEVEPGRVTVRNGSWAAPREHEYSVRVIDGVPTECTCPADEHHDGACKHRVAVAIRGPVRDAAARDVPVADGGIEAIPEIVENVDPDEDASEPDLPEDCACAGMPDGLPCWPCYRDGVKQLPSERD